MHVDDYSVCERVELFLNEQSLGVKPSTKEERFIANFGLPNKSGVLKAVGYLRDGTTTEFAIKTAGPPAQSAWHLIA